MEDKNILKTHNLFIATNDIKPLIDFKRGVMTEDDEYTIIFTRVKKGK